MPPVDYTTFRSSNLEAGLYDYGSQDLYIKFHGDRIYVYLFVPEEEWDGLTSAASHGSYHYHNIRMDYPYEELTASDFPQQGRALIADRHGQSTADAVWQTRGMQQFLLRC